MSITVDFLEVKDFRNYEWFLLELGQELTIIEGPNATGKTNLIEALQLLSAGESFRNPRWNEVIREGADVARASLTATGDGREIAVVLDVERDQGRTYRLNGNRRRSVSAATGTIPCVLFTPDDLLMVKGSSEMRRGAVDALGSQMSATYDALRKEYGKVLRHRNALLKKGEGPDVLSALTEQLIDTGSRLMAHRESLVEKLSGHAEGVFLDVTGGNSLTLSYERSWDRDSGGRAAGEGRELFANALERSSAKEMARGVTLTGPHRDDIAVQIDGKPARAYGSQGQQRSVVLAWKLAEVAVIEEVVARKPLLLLDDVMSELDEARRHALAVRVKGSVQTVMTTTNLHYFDQALLEGGRVVRLGRE